MFWVVLVGTHIPFVVGLGLTKPHPAYDWGYVFGLPLDISVFLCFC